MCSKVLEKYNNVEVIKLDKLSVDHAKDLGAKVMLRGLRAVSDFEYEVQLSNLNRTMNPKIESLFLSPDEKYSFISSSIIKDIANHNGDLKKFLDEYVEKKLIDKIKYIYLFIYSKNSEFVLVDLSLLSMNSIASSSSIE